MEMDIDLEMKRKKNEEGRCVSVLKVLRVENRAAEQS